jgi:hypothetical protein
LTRDWHQWHREYESDPSRAMRLNVVRDEIASALDRSPAGPVRAICMCAGDGRDLLGVLARHSRAGDVEARLVELDPELARSAASAAAKLGLTGIEVRVADAGSSTSYVGAVPADLTLVCGVFGNITDDDVHATVNALPMLCTVNATVIWTRHRREPDLTPQIRRWLAVAGFDELSFTPIPGGVASVGVHRFAGPTAPLDPGQRWFSFVSEAPQP